MPTLTQGSALSAPQQVLCNEHLSLGFTWTPQQVSHTDTISLGSPEPQSGCLRASSIPSVPTQTSRLFQMLQTLLTFWSCSFPAEAVFSQQAPGCYFQASLRTRAYTCSKPSPPPESDDSSVRLRLTCQLFTQPDLLKCQAPQVPSHTQPGWVYVQPTPKTSPHIRISALLWGPTPALRWPHTTPKQLPWSHPPHYQVDRVWGIQPVVPQALALINTNTLSSPISRGGWFLSVSAWGHLRSGFLMHWSRKQCRKKR